MHHLPRKTTTNILAQQILKLFDVPPKNYRINNTFLGCFTNRLHIFYN